MGGKSLSPGMPISMSAGSSGWYFDFPQSPNSVHYVTRATTEAARSGIRMSFEISGNVEFKEADCGGVGCVPGPGGRGRLLPIHGASRPSLLHRCRLSAPGEAPA